MKYFIIEHIVNKGYISLEQANAIEYLRAREGLDFYLRSIGIEKTDLKLYGMDKVLQDLYKRSSQIYFSEYLLDRGYMTKEEFDKIYNMLHSSDLEIRYLAVILYDSYWENVRKNFNSNEKTTKRLLYLQEENSINGISLGRY